MFINLNHLYSILLHILILYCCLFIFKIEKKTNKYKEVININLKSIKNFNSENISLENNIVDITKKEEIKEEIKNNTENSTKIKDPKKEAYKKIKENDSIKEFKEQKEDKKKSQNEDPLEKNLENRESKIISQQQDFKKKKIISSEVFTNEDEKTFNDYNKKLKALIQKNATKNYPRISLRKKEEGIVELKFSIDINGNIVDINIGKETSAPQRLINASINTLELISPYKKNPILKKNNTFSIIIVYKLE